MEKRNPKDPRALFYSSKLLGITKICGVPKCGEKDTSTGWLHCEIYQGKPKWSVEFECSYCGTAGRWSAELNILIDETLQEIEAQGISIETLIRTKLKK